MMPGLFKTPPFVPHLKKEITEVCIYSGTGYPCRSYLLTPIQNPQGERERKYNAAHVTTRNCVERSFGVLKSRFDCLKTLFRTELRTSKRITMACAVLHNIAIDQRVTSEMDDDADNDDNEGNNDNDGSDGLVNAVRGIQVINGVVDT